MKKIIGKYYKNYSIYKNDINKAVLVARLLRQENNWQQKIDKRELLAKIPRTRELIDKNIEKKNSWQKLKGQEHMTGNIDKRE